MFHRPPVHIEPDDVAANLQRDALIVHRAPQLGPHPTISSAEARAIAHRFRTEIGGAYEAVAAQIEHDHPEQLQMLANGVVPDQAEAAMVTLRGRACDRLRAAPRDQAPR